jgi:hypothetical protein
MANTVFVDVFDDGAYGAKVVTNNPPSICPGMGGWKKEENGTYFTRIKGEEGVSILRAFGHGGYGEITIDAAGIRSMTPFHY